MSEDDLLSAVLDLCKVRHWRTLHIRPLRTVHGWRTAVQGDGVGFPDIIAIRGSRMIAAELKSDKGKTTAEQDAWLEAFRLYGAEAYTWRPYQLQAIAAVLA